MKFQIAEQSAIDLIELPKRCAGDGRVPNKLIF